MELDPLDPQNFLNTSIGDFLGCEYSEADSCTVEWIRLLHDLDQPGLPGWPLITPNLLLPKCEKCPRKFCSTMNSKRHFHVEHKLKKRDKGSDILNTRRSLGEFVDGLQLSPEEEKRVLSFEEVQLGDDIKGPDLVGILADLIWHTAFPPLTRECLKAGYDLMVLLQGRGLPDDSNELFSILDNASESTFLCGEAASMEGIVFGTSSWNAISRDNLIASVSFLLEKRLVKEKLAHDKVIAEARLAEDERIAEALQASLMEEEEAAKKRQAKQTKRNKKKKEKRNKKKAEKQKEATDLDALPAEVLSASGDSSGNSSDDNPPTEGSSSLPPAVRGSMPHAGISSPAETSGSLAPSDRGPIPPEVQSSPAETSSSLVLPESGSTLEDLASHAETLLSFEDWDLESAEDPESEWHEVVRGRQKAPARSQPGISIGSQAGQKYHPSKSGGRFDVAPRSQTMPSKGDAGHSGRGRQQAPARSQSEISRGFQGDQNYPPLKFGATKKNVGITIRTPPLVSRKVGELESHANQKPAWRRLKTIPDAATEQSNQEEAKNQKPANVEESLKAKADASATKQPDQAKAKQQKPADEEGNIIRFGKMAFPMPVAVGSSSDHHEAYKEAKAEDSSLNADQTSSSEVTNTSLPAETSVVHHETDKNAEARDSSLDIPDQATTNEIGNTSLPLETYEDPVDLFLWRSGIPLETSVHHETESRDSSLDITDQASSNEAGSTSLPLETYEDPVDLFLWRSGIPLETYEYQVDLVPPSDSAAGVESSEPPKTQDSSVNPDQVSSSEAGGTSLPVETYLYPVNLFLSRPGIPFETYQHPVHLFAPSDSAAGIGSSEPPVNPDQVSSSEAGGTPSPFDTYVHPVNHFPFDIQLLRHFHAERWRAAPDGEHDVYDPSSYSEAPSSSAAGVESSGSPKGENLDNAADNTASRDSEASVQEAAPGDAAATSSETRREDIVMESDSDTSADIAATKCLHASIRDLLGIPFEAVDKCIVQWIKLLHALDHPDCPGWPLLSSITSDEQLLKCDKCPRCFCSEINRNRHFHVEHRSKNHDQDSANTRRLALGEFWAGLSDEEKKEILSFEEVQLKVSVDKAKRAATHLSDEEVRLGVIKGSTLLEMVSDLVWFEAFPPLTRACMRAGYDLWNILQDPENPDIDRRLSISSEDLFSILDNASESTFLCGEAASMEEIVFGASNTSAIREINSIASSSFLLEKRMVEKMLSHSKIIAEARLADDARMAEALQASLMLDEARHHPEIYPVPTAIKSAKDLLAESEQVFNEPPSLDSEAPSDSAAGVESPKGQNLDKAGNTGNRDTEASVLGKTDEDKIRTSVLKSVLHGRREKDLIVQYFKEIHGDRYEFKDIFPHYESSTDSGDESDTGNGKSESPSNSAANTGPSESFKVEKLVQDKHEGNTASQLLQREVSSFANDTAGLSLEARFSRLERMFALLVDVISKKRSDLAT